MRRAIPLLGVFALVLASCGGDAEERKASPSARPGASASASVHAGTIAFLAAELGGAPDIYLINTDGTGLTRLTSDADAGNPYWSGSPAWSPDGTKIAWGGSNSSVGGDVWVMNADGSEKTQLTHGSVGPNWPVWSPDGTKIAFTESRPDFAIAISVMDADGSGVKRVTSGPYDLLPAWAPDGTILFLRADPSNDKGDVFAVAPDGSGLVRLTRGRHVGGYGLSPDGTRLAVHDAQQHRIVILPVDGSGGAPGDAPRR